MKRKPETKSGSWLPLGFVCVIAVLGAFFLLSNHSAQKSVILSVSEGTSEAFDPPPQDLNINGERWAIYSFDFDRDKAFGARNGQTQCDTRTIFYDAKRIKTKAYLRETMWHEVIHARHCKLDTKGNDKKANWREFTQDYPEHNSVYELGMFLPGFVHDNPEFIKWAEEWK